MDDEPASVPEPHQTRSAARPRGEGDPSDLVASVASPKTRAAAIILLRAPLTPMAIVRSAPERVSCSLLQGEPCRSGRSSQHHPTVDGHWSSPARAPVLRALDA